MIEISTPLYVGDVVEMRKVHPCGGKTWEVVRVGADIDEAQLVRVIRAVRAAGE